RQRESPRGDQLFIAFPRALPARQAGPWLGAGNRDTLAPLSHEGSLRISELSVWDDFVLPRGRSVKRFIAREAGRCASGEGPDRPTRAGRPAGRRSRCYERVKFWEGSRPGPPLQTI